MNYFAGLAGGVLGGCLAIYFLTFILGKFLAKEEEPLRRALQLSFLATVLAMAIYWLIGNEGQIYALQRAAITYIPAGLIIAFLRWKSYQKQWIDE